MVPLGRLLVAAFAGALVLLGADARAQGRADLEKGRAAYLARSFQEAEQRLRALVDPNTGTKERAVLSQARMYLGATLLAQGRRAQAEEVFEKLILEDPAFEPDPLGFPGNVVNTFIDARVQLQERIKAAAQTAAKLEAERRAREEAERRAREAWFEKVKAQAAEERVTVRNNRWVAFVPFGAGQFQNRDEALGWAFLGVEASLVLATGVTWPLYVYERDRANTAAASGDIDVDENGTPRRTADVYQQRAENLHYWNLGFATALAVVAGIGIVQANIAFVPQFDEKRKRPLPSLTPASAKATGLTGLRLGPLVAPVGRLEAGAPSGLVIGVTGVSF